MSPKVKIGITLVATLLLGIVIGVAFHGVFEESRNEQRLRNMLDEEGFIRYMEDDLSIPEAKRAQVRAIIASYAEESTRANRRYFVEVNQRMDGLVNELSTVLSEEEMVDMVSLHKRMNKIVGRIQLDSTASDTSLPAEATTLQ